MGAWKNWEIGMIEDGNTPEQIKSAATRIKGTLADPLASTMPVEFLAYKNMTREEREQAWLDRAVRLLIQAFPGAELVDEQQKAA